MPIEQLECGVWVVVGDQLRTLWIKERKTLDVDHLMPDLRKLIRPGDTVIDVGANIGDHTYYYREAVGSSGRVIAFEPDPDCHAACVLNCGTFDGIYRAAAIDSRRSLGLKVEPNRGQNSIKVENGDIVGFPIDDLQLDRCDLIKVDVEGAELLTLSGARRTIERCRPKIVCEFEDDQLKRFGTSIKELKQFIVNMGYTERDLKAGWDRDRLFVPSY